MPNAACLIVMDHREDLSRYVIQIQAHRALYRDYLMEIRRRCIRHTVTSLLERVSAIHGRIEKLSAEKQAVFFAEMKKFVEAEISAESSRDESLGVLCDSLDGSQTTLAARVLLEEAEVIQHCALALFYSAVELCLSARIRMNKITATAEQLEVILSGAGSLLFSELGVFQEDYLAIIAEACSVGEKKGLSNGVKSSSLHKLLSESRFFELICQNDARFFDFAGISARCGTFFVLLLMDRYSPGTIASGIGITFTVTDLDGCLWSVGGSDGFGLQGTKNVNIGTNGTMTITSQVFIPPIQAGSLMRLSRAASFHAMDVGTIGHVNHGKSTTTATSRRNIQHRYGVPLELTCAS